MNWTQPCCRACWDALEPNRAPVVLAQPDEEQCAWCGDLTSDGIYVREHPNHVNYPAGGE